MKKYLYHTFSIGCLGFALTCIPGCKKAEDITISAAKPEKDIKSFFGTDNSVNRPKVIHLYSDTVYNVSESFTREAGEQLLIDEGTVLKAATATITIKPGGVLLANGTSDHPIVFTSASAAGTQNKNWGGIIIQGNAADNSVTASGNPADFSGTLRYIRIEFAGLVLTGAGSGTTVENIQVSYAQGRPAFEIDGGTFNARNLLSYACGGSVDFYITRGYTGKMQNVLAYRHPFFGVNNPAPPNVLAGVFIENNPDDTAKRPYTNPIISNLTVIGPNALDGSSAVYSDTVSSRSAALVTSRNARFRIRNSLLLGFPEGAWYLDDSLIAAALVGKRSEFTYSIVQSNDSARAFYLKPGAYIPFSSKDFNEYMLVQCYDRQFKNAGDLMFRDPFNYDAPDPMPKEGSPVLTGADFSGADYSDAYFNKVTYTGAIGSDNWLRAWTNFTPLKTNYNFPK